MASKAHAATATPNRKKDMTDSTLQTILIVDDSAFIRNMLRNFLRRQGWNHVLEADNGSRAWEILKKKQVSAVISDWIMPQMSGIELLERIRADKELQSVPFLMVTVNSQQDHVAEALNKGCTDYLVKPMNLQVLAGKLEEALRINSPN